MIESYTNAIKNLDNSYNKLLTNNIHINVVVDGNISKTQFRQLIDNSISFCEKNINYWQQIPEYSAMSNVFTSYKRTLESAISLLGETKNTENNFTYNGKILEQLLDKVEVCKHKLESSNKKITETINENQINDLTDKLLLIEKEFDSGNISNEKAYKHILKIKNSFNHLQLKTNNIEHDNNVDSMQAIIDESEKTYKTNLDKEISESCNVCEFLVDQSSKDIKDLISDTENLTQDLNKFTDELSNIKLESKINLDTLYNYISTINNSASQNSIYGSDLNRYINQLNKQIDLMREQQLGNVFKSQDMRNFADIVYGSSIKLKEKCNKATQNIITNENTNRVNKISSQIESLSEIAPKMNSDLAIIVDMLLFKQSRYCLESNPELQTQINQNCEKGKTIFQTLTKAI